MGAKKRLVLSLDGGGIKGHATSWFLYHLENALGKPICQVFDLISGTSAGGITALQMGVLQKTMPEIVKLNDYKTAKRIFNKKLKHKIPLYRRLKDEPKYDGMGKSQVLSENFMDICMGNAPTHTMVTAIREDGRQCEFESWNKDHEKILAARAADITSAAPTFFPTVYEENLGYHYIDGGVSVNDPVLLAVESALTLWPSDNIYILSVGTGWNIRGFKGKESKGYGIFGWMMKGNLINLMQNRKDIQKYFRRRSGNRYLRVNSSLYHVNDDMDDCSKKNIDNLKKLGYEWFRFYGTRSLKLINKALS